jgi:hypothetical protein
MLWWLFVTIVGAASPKPWDGKSSDVVVERTVDASVDVLVPRLADLTFAEGIFPPECVSDWAHGSVSSGPGAIGRVTYTMGAMRRRLTAEVTRVEDHVVEYDHEGKKGFITQWRLSPDGDGTAISLGTYINAPPWPFRGMYFKKIHPEWMRCYEQTLENLVRALP